MRAITPPSAPSIRFRVEPGDVPPEKAARRLHLTLAEFTRLLPDLRRRGFPDADPTTGMYDLEAIDEWRRNRWRKEGLTLGPPTQQASAMGMSERFNAAKNGNRNG